MPWNVARTSVCLCTFILVAALASAQSRIAGVVTDESGAVLPGVAVEAASSVLIEKVRTAVTDGQGRFDIANLRAGDYTVTFTLPGFNVVKREGLTVPDNFTATANAVLKLGTLDETVIVTGASPVVDVRQVQQTQVVPRDLLDALPTGRNFRSMGSLITAVRPQRQNLGDSNPWAQTIAVRGMGTNGTVILIDGLSTNSMQTGFAAYSNDAAIQEISYQTSANTADVSYGGLRANMVPRDGGNAMHGGGFFSFLEGRWQANNLTPELQTRGLRVANRVVHTRDYNPWVSGPVRRDRVWFLGSFRRVPIHSQIGDAFYKDGRPGVHDRTNVNATARLTMQLSQRNKLSLHYDRLFANEDTWVNPGEEVDTASQKRDYSQTFYPLVVAKWTSTVSNKLMVEAGYSEACICYIAKPQPGIARERGTPEWYANARHQDTVLNTVWKSTSANWLYPRRKHLMSALSYVTGSHNLKVGAEWAWGEFTLTREVNADLTQIYLAGVPSFVDVEATPWRSTTKLKADLGVYAMDSWSFNRLTLNAGVRVDYFNSYVPAQGSPAGRFAPLRQVSAIDCMPCFPAEVAPRVGVAYDLFGNGRTALKGGVYKYNENVYLQLTQAYSPLNLGTDRRTWRDVNADDIAQDNEIGLSNNRNFGTVGTPNRRPAPDLDRQYTWEYTAGVQHQLVPGVAVSASWNFRQFRNLIVTRNVLVGLNDYSPFEITNPLEGGTLTVFKRDPSKQGLTDNVDTTATDSDTARRTYNSFEVNLSARLGTKATVFGGFIMERTLTVACDVNDPNLLRFCDQTGTLYQDLGRVPSIPYTKGFKVNGMQPLPYGVGVGLAFQSYDGCGNLNCQAANIWLPVTYTVPSALFPGGQTQSVTVDLATPMTRTLGRWNQLDLSLQKNVRLRNVELQGRLEIFNVTNENTVMQEITAFGPRLGIPQEILQGRIPRVAFQVRF